MAAFVVGRHLPIFILDHLGFPGESHIDFVLGLLEVNHGHLFRIPLGGV